MDDKIVQWFAFVRGVFVPIVDDQVHEGGYLVNQAVLAEQVQSGLAWAMDGGDYDPGGRFVLPVEACSGLLRVESAAGDVTATVSFG